MSLGPVIFGAQNIPEPTSNLLAASALSIRIDLRWLVVMSFCAHTISFGGCSNRADRATQPSGTSGDVTFARHVAPIVFKKCATCHHPGEAAPFNLLTYDDVRRRANQIVDVTQSRFMPPWLPTDGHGKFVGDRRLADQDVHVIQEWVSGGMPLGDESEMPSAPVFSSGWQTGTPDLVLETPPYTLSSEGRDEFRNFVVPIQLDLPRWVRSIELRPDNPRVTHHARLGVDSLSESTRRDAEDNEPGYAGMAWAQDPDGQLVIWTPGIVATGGQPRVAWRLYPNTILVLHTHMQPSGKPEVIKFRIGIHFAQETPDTFPVMLRIGSCNIDIPPGASRHVVTDEYVLPIEVDLHTIFPHAHSHCTDLHVVAERPDGSREPLISIERFDENWHDCYRYQHPVRLSRGTRLISTFAYDNSAGNIRNRNHPPRRVVYGSNAEDEMADVYLQVTAVQADQRAVLMEHYKRYEMQSQIVGFRKSLEVYPENPWIREGLATYLFGSGKPGDAIAVLEQRLKTGPPAIFPMVSLGMCRLASREYSRAESELRSALKMDREYPLAWLGLAKALTGQKNVEQAEQAYRRALELAPALSEARLNLADLLMQRGQLEEAAAVCSAAMNDSPNAADACLKMAEIRAKERRYDESLKYNTEARRLAPYTHPAKVLLAVNCFQNGDKDKAQALLHEALAESPEHPVAALMLGQLARQEREWESARRYLATAASRTMPDNWPESHRQRFVVVLHTERLQLAQQLHDVELARSSLTDWLKFDPENTQLRKMLDELGATEP